MISQYVAIILWDRYDAPIADILEKIKTLQTLHFKKIILATVHNELQLPSIPGISIITDKNKIGSLKALGKALRFLQVHENIHYNNLLLIYSGAPFNARTLSRFMQISTIVEKKPNIEGFVSLRVTRGHSRARFEVDTNSIICRKYQAISGHEINGVFLLSYQLLGHIYQQNSNKFEDFISWCLETKHQLFAVLESCGQNS
jgi:hypothetical protein